MPSDSTCESHFFHVSAQVFKPGENIGPFATNAFIGQVSQKNTNVARLEDAFEERRLSGLPARTRAVFAFDRVMWCEAFWHSEATRGRLRDLYIDRPYYYEVSLDRCHRAPFAMATYALKIVTSGRKPEAPVDEYWHPQHEWNIWEYLGESATVIRRIRSIEEDRFGLMKIKLSEDLHLARLYWPITER